MGTKTPFQSLTIKSAIVGIIVLIGSQFGVDFDSGEITEVVTLTIQLVSAVGVVYGRVRAKTVITA